MGVSENDLATSELQKNVENIRLHQSRCGIAESEIFEDLPPGDQDPMAGGWHGSNVEFDRFSTLVSSWRSPDHCQTLL